MAQNLQQLRLELADERRHTAYLLREMDKLQEKIRALTVENQELHAELTRCHSEQYNDNNRSRNRNGGARRRRQTRRN